MGSDLDAAESAIRRGDLVVYPTETVYGLGADALDETAIVRVFDAKRRPRDQPLSLAVPSVEAAGEFIELDERTQRCMATFLPGPVTVVGRKTALVPDALTGGRDRVGIRVPDHTLARELLDRVAPITATSANVSGEPSVREPADLGESLRDVVAVVLDGGRTPGGASTVVDPGRELILRRGRLVEAVEAWLDEQDG